MITMRQSLGYLALVTVAGILFALVIGGTVSLGNALSAQPPVLTQTPPPSNLEVDEYCTTIGANPAVSECVFPDGLRCVVFSQGGVTCDWAGNK